MSMPEPQGQQLIDEAALEAAYQKFQDGLKRVMADFDSAIKTIHREIDQEKIQDLRKKLGLS
jgi:DNA-binding transcriptional regulator YiaG